MKWPVPLVIGLRQAVAGPLTEPHQAGDRPERVLRQAVAGLLTEPHQAGDQPERVLRQAVAGLLTEPHQAGDRPERCLRKSWSKFIGLAAIVLLAAFLRLYQLPTLPPGLNFDEAGNGVAAMEILQGAPRLWWQIGGGKEPLWPYLIALTTSVLGYIPLALRLPAAFSGVLTVAAVYPLATTLFRAEGRGQAHLIGWLTMLGVALSAWHLHFSRLGFRAILLPLLSTLAFYFLWRAFTKESVAKDSPPDLPEGEAVSPSPLAGGIEGGRNLHPPTTPNLVSSFLGGRLTRPALFLALTSYAYLAGRLLPLVLILFCILHWLKTRPALRPFSLPKLIQTNPYLQPTLTCLLLTTLFLSPLILYFIYNPADFNARAGAVSIFNPAWNNGDLLGTFWQTLRLTLGTFLGLSGDPNPLVNLPHQPALPLILVPFLLLGLLTTLYKIFLQPSNPPTLQSSISQSPNFQPPYLFLLTWWLTMLLPALLAPEGAPHHLRLIGTLIPTYLFVALGFTTCLTFLKTRLPVIRYLLPATCYLLLLFQTTTHYFSQWPTSTDFTLPFDLYAVDLATEIAQAPPETAYVLPMDIRAQAEARHYTLDYLLALSPAAYYYLPVDERNATEILTKAAVGKTELRVVRWQEDKHREADEKEIVTYLLTENATLSGHETRRVYDLETYDLATHATRFALPEIDQLIDANFDNLLRLDAAFVPETASPGDWLPVAITLAPLAPLEVDYKASLRLLNTAGERILQKDRTLKHNFHQGTSLWPPETVNEYYLLPIPADLPPGEVTVVLVIYHPDTQAPLVAEGVVEVPLGKSMVGRLP